MKEQLTPSEDRRMMPLHMSLSRLNHGLVKLKVLHIRTDSAERRDEIQFTQVITQPLIEVKWVAHIMNMLLQTKFAQVTSIIRKKTR
jgi:hypothetical protein